jgi:hypothetical protein
MSDRVFLLGLFFILLIAAGSLYIGAQQVKENQVEKNWCVEGGGIPIVTDKGRLRACLKPDSVIEKPEN